MKTLLMFILMFMTIWCISLVVLTINKKNEEDKSIELECCPGVRVICGKSIIIFPWNNINKVSDNDLISAAKAACKGD